MNNVFEISRFGLLLNKHWSENRNKYLLSLGAIFALLLLWMGFLIMVEHYHAIQRDIQIATFYVGLFLTGSLFASLLFSDLANKPKAINYMSVPASQLEKLLVNLVFCVFIFFACYTAVFYLADMLMVKLSNSVAQKYWLENQTYINGILRPFEPERIANVFYDEKIDRSAPFNVLLFILTIFLTVQGAYALGSIYFPTYSFIKTTIVLLLIILFFVFFIGKILYNTMPHGNFVDESLTFRPGGFMDYGTEEKVVVMPAWYMAFIKGPARYILVLVFWATAYFRLKEKEV